MADLTPSALVQLVDAFYADNGPSVRASPADILYAINNMRDKVLAGIRTLFSRGQLISAEHSDKLPGMGDGFLAWLCADAYKRGCVHVWSAIASIEPTFLAVPLSSQNGETTLHLAARANDMDSLCRMFEIRSAAAASASAIPPLTWDNDRL